MRAPSVLLGDRDETEPSLGDRSAIAKNDSGARTKSHSPRTRLALDERRARLLRIGCELFAEYGYDELSVEDIARRAKISRGLLYHYFPNKREFYAEVIRTGALELLSETEPPPGLDLLTSFERGLDGYLDYVEKHAKTFNPILRGSAAFEPDVREIVEATREAVVARMLGALPYRSHRVRNALRGFIGFVEGAVLDWLEHGDVSRADLTSVLVEFGRRALLAAAG
jgi:AcrR family transcriptional regulator